MLETRPGQNGAEIKLAQFYLPFFYFPSRPFSPIGKKGRCKQKYSPARGEYFGLFRATCPCPKKAKIFMNSSETAQLIHELL